MKNILHIVSFLSIFSASVSYAAQSVPVTVKEGEKSFQGDLYTPDKVTQPLPLVLVVHEWWGKNDYVAMRAKKIADELGYAALAVDLYGDGKTVQTPDEAGALAGPFYKDPSKAVSRLKAFIAAAPEVAKKSSVSIDTAKIAAIGYCFGGGQALNLARADKFPPNEKLLGVVSFHGSLTSSLKAHAPIQTKLLVLHGAADQMVKAKDVADFKAEMKKDKADLKFIVYPGAMHAFTNPRATEVGRKYKIPIAYNASADAKSWEEMRTFLDHLFKK